MKNNMQDDLVLMNPNIPLPIVGCGKTSDDEITLTYIDSHVFEITFDSKKVSVVLSAKKTSKGSAL